MAASARDRSKSVMNEHVQLCAECATVAASCRCIKCECFMCFACFEEVHKVSKYMRKHQYEPLANASLTKGCGEHVDRSVEYFCLDDEKAICAHCVVMGSHKNHAVCLLDERKEKLLEAIALLSTTAKDNLIHLRKPLDMIDTLISTSHFHEESVVLDLQKHFEELCFLLKSRQERLEQEFHHACADKLKALMEIRSDISSRKKHLEEAVTELSKLDVNNIIENSHVLETLQDAVGRECVLPNSFLSHIKMDLNAANLIDHIILHGKVVENGDEAVASETISGNNLGTGDCQSTSEVISAVTNSMTLPRDVEVYEPHSPPKTQRMTELPRSPPCLRRVTGLPSGVVLGQSMASNLEFQNSEVDSVSVQSFGAIVASAMPVKIETPVSVFVPMKTETENLSLSQSKVVPPPLTADVPGHNSNSGQEMPHSVPSMKLQSSIAENRAASCSSFDVQPKPISLGRLIKQSSTRDLSLLSWKQGLKAVSDVDCSEIALQSSTPFGFSNRMEPVVISHIHHPGFFWVRFTKDLEQLSRLSQSIQDYCNGNHPVIDNFQRQFHFGEMVLAKFHDGTWYRAQVIKRNSSGTEDDVEVRFIDYGFTDTVAIDKVEAMRPFFLKVPQLVSSCCLADIAPSGGDLWSPEAVESFAHMTSNSQMMIKVVEQGSVLKVRMSWPLGDGIRDEQILYVNDTLVFLEHAAYINPDCKLPNIDKKVASKYIRPVPPSKDVVIPVLITNVKSPHEFYVQIHEKDALYFVDMMKDIHKTCTTDSQNGLGLFLPFVGISCLVNFGSDNQPHWCRAEVVELLKKGHVRVRNIDFGGEKEVSIFHLKKLMDKFQVIPAQALGCCLADVEPAPGRSWDITASELLEDLRFTPLFMSVKEFSSGQMLCVYLSTDAGFPSENLVNFMLITRDLAVASKMNVKLSREVPEKVSFVPSKLPTSEKLIRTSPKLNSLARPAKEQVLSVANLPKVIISHFASPDEFYIQVAAPKNMKRLENLMQELNAEYENSVPIVNAEWKGANECVARLPKDKQWYRAKITAIIGDQAKVLCRDYGYSYVIGTNDLRTVLPQFRSTAWFSTRCHLVDIKPSGPTDGWPESTCETLQKMTRQKICHISMTGPAVGVSLPADIVLTETVKGSALMPDRENYISVTDWLLGQRLALPISCPKTSLDHMSEHDSDLESGGSEFADVDEDQVATPERHLTNHSAARKTPCSSVVDFLMPEEPRTNSFVLAVTFVNKDCCIYGQEAKADLRLLTDLMQQVQSYYRYTMPESNCTVWTLGQPVAAQFLDDNLFYRAKIVGFRDDGIEVQYVDYGNAEVLSKERLRILDESFLAIPIQCFSCHLFKIRPASSNNRWSEAAIGAIDELVNNKGCRITIREKDASQSKLFVDLKLPSGEDLGSVLCAKGLALHGLEISTRSSSFETHSPPVICNGNGLPVTSRRLLPERTVPSPYSQMMLPALGDILHVLVTEIDSPNSLYVQHIPLEHPDMVFKRINSDLDKLLHLSSVYSSDVAHYQPLTESELVPGMPCVARYSADDCWYRAEVICTVQVRGCMEVGVRFIDYGSSDFVSVDRLRAIPVEHLSLPAQCRKCGINGVEMISDDELYLADVTEKLTKLFTSRVVVAVVRCVLSEGNLLVDILDRDLYLEIGSACPCLYQGLIDDGLLDFTSCKSRRDSVEVESGEEEEESTSLQLESGANKGRPSIQKSNSRD